MASSPRFGPNKEPSVYHVIGTRLLINFAGALAVAILMSTQFLAQIFVWQYYAGDEIFAGWVLIFRDRFIVAGGIALALTLAEAAWKWDAKYRIVGTFVAILGGAIMAEVALQWFDPQSGRSGIVAMAGRILRWAIVAGAACAILHLWRRSESIASLNHATELRRLRTEHLLTRLRIEALQRQIEPHFLFNTLATIRRLQRSSPKQGRHLLSSFLDFLRGTLDSRDVVGTSLGDELAVASAYLEICSIRMGGALGWSINAPEALHDLAFPRFGLATLLENAVKHGISPSPSGGTITVTAKEELGELEVIVADTGIGFSSDLGTGIGLANIREQLALQYGPMASLALTSNRPTGVRAAIRLPATPQ